MDIKQKRSTKLLIIQTYKNIQIKINVYKLYTQIQNCSPHKLSNLYNRKRNKLKYKKNNLKQKLN